ncbi:ABC transporter substrate-binding protein [Candidatus Margulisiibacteriota bacterium]
MNKIIRFFIVIISIFIISMSSIYGSVKKILILNSDSSNKKYLLYENSYRKNLYPETIVVKADSKNMNSQKFRELVKDENPDLIFTVGSLAYQTAVNANSMKPIVFSGIVNWKRFPVGKNVYGVANEFKSGMQLFTFRNFFPKIKKLGIIYSPSMNKEWIQNIQEISKQMDFIVISKALDHQDQIKDTLDDLIPRVDAMWLIADPAIVSNRDQLIKYFQKTNKAGKMIFTYNDLFTRVGATLALAIDMNTFGSQAASLTYSVLNNENLRSKIYYPAGVFITVNLKKIQELGIEVNYSVLNTANKIIK